MLAEIKFLSAQSILDCIPAPDPEKTICNPVPPGSFWVNLSIKSKNSGSFW
jgi:hypothetical protein